MIYFITKAEAKSLLTPDEQGKYHGPRPGMEFDWYLVFNDPGWTAIDNSSGDAWTEDFNTIEEAIRWLESEESKYDAEEEEKEAREEQPEPPDEFVKSDLEREYDRIREAAKADKLAEETRRRNVDAAVNKAVDELFELVKFVNKDGWQVDVCRVNNRHYLSSSDWQKTVKVELVPVVGQDVKFVAKGHVHHYGFTNCEPLTIPELAKWIVLLLANKDN